MKYVPRAPREGINVSDQHPLAEAATLIAGLIGILIVVALVVVFFVDLVILFVAPRTEAWLFQDMVIEQLQSVDYDSEQARSLQTRVDTLAEGWPDNPYEFQAGILESAQPNALAVPGGVILVTQALVEQAESENELSFVIGHEIGHFKNRDHIRQLGRAALLSLMVAALLGQNSEALSGNVVNFTLRSFSRAQESEADQFGLQLVYEDYGHVGHSADFFERAAEEAGELGALTAFASSHPSPEDRIGRLLQYAKHNGWPLDGPITPLSATP